MSIALESFCCILLLMIPSQVELSTCIGVAVCGCLIYSNVVLNTMACLDFIKISAHSSPEADDITFLIICDMVRIYQLLSL